MNTESDMLYVSTRGGEKRASFSEILLAGTAQGGGLWVPARTPQVSPHTLRAWSQLPYRELAVQVIRLFAPELDEGDLRAMTQRVYNTPRFSTNAVVPMRWLEATNRRTSAPWNIGIAGLSEGPTLAFKDIALQLLGELVPYQLKKVGGRTTIVGATSGDTGSAAIEAFKNKPRVSVVMLSPQGRMSEFQRAQMYSVLAPNIVNVVVNGTFDDCQDMAKAIMNDAEFSAANQVSAVNSVNFARIVAQVVYYFWVYFRTQDHYQRYDLRNISFSIPSGNFGNAYACYEAKRMGLPIDHIIIATNENDVLHTFFAKGKYKPWASKDVKITQSPSMDISAASNLERLIYNWGRELFVNYFFQELKSQTSAMVPERTMDPCVTSVRVKETTCAWVARRAFNSYGVQLDPHTAIGAAAALRNNARSTGPIICMETAKPAKFRDFVYKTTGTEPEVPEHLADLLKRPQKWQELAAGDLDGLKKIVEKMSHRD